MKKFNTLNIIFFTLTTYLFSQEKIGEWATHFSYENPTQVVKAKEKAFVIADGKLYSYNPSDNQIEIYSKITGLNDNDITRLAYNKKTDCLLIIYSNANFDLLFGNGNIINIPNLRQVTTNLDKTINDVFAYQEFFYISTNFGFITINAEKLEIRETVNFNTPFYSVFRDENTIYAANNSGVIQCNLSENIQDRSKWKTFPVSTKYAHSKDTFEDKEIRKIFYYGNKLHFFIPEKAIYYLAEDTRLEPCMQGQKTKDIISHDNDHLIAYRNDAFFYGIGLGEFKGTAVNELSSVDFAGNKQFFVTTKNNCLSLIKPALYIEEYTYDTVASDIKPNGPLSNTPFFMTFEQGKLLVTGGWYTSTKVSELPFQLSEYSPTEKDWFKFDYNQIYQVTKKRPQNSGVVITDPKNPNHLFVTTWGYGMYEFLDKKCIKHHHFQILVDGLAYDNKGNLWTSNSVLGTGIRVLKNNNTWSAIPLSPLDNVENIKSLLIDKYNRKWYITGHHKTYIVVFDEKGTIDDTSDDRFLWINKLVNQNGTSQQIRYFNCIAEDKDSNIWLGTDSGPYIIYNSTNIFDKSPVLNQIVIPREDGTNNIDYLLNGVIINAIKVDDANRKWIATAGAGLYLVSSDGTKTIHHFTTDNSPLPSNVILSLAIDEENGMVYIGSQKGVVSYQSDAGKPKEDFKNVSVSPNPVRPNYTGEILISGLKANTVVKITDINANILTQGQSLGGNFSWDGRNTQGRKVTTGVYLVFGSTEDGKEGVVAKIMIVN